jgi:Skp family chaperone for outer membrane proteins
MRRSGRTTAWIAAALLASACAAAAPVPGPSAAAYADDQKDEKKDKKFVDPADVYYGDATKWEKPAEVDADKVYAKIDEYKEIVDKGLKPGDAKYEILMSTASKRFCKAVKKTAKDGGYDLVARMSCVKGCGTVPDITSDVIANL